MQTPNPPPSTDRFAPELQKLTTEYTERKQALITAHNQSREANRSTIYTQGSLQLYQELVPKYLILANKAKGTVSGLRARAMHLSLMQPLEPRPAPMLALAQELVRLEGKNPDMGNALSKLSGLIYALQQPADQQKLLALLSEVERITPYPGVKAQALYERGKILHRFKNPEALALMKQVVAKYPTTSAAAEAKNVLYELENLQIGMVVPEVTGRDENNVAFKLSDYRGKVVVLDFWGFW